MRTILIEGASTAFGMFDHEQGGWAHRLHTESLAYSATRMHDPTIVRNLSVPGITLSGIVRSFEGHATALKGARRKAVVLSVGLNEAKIFPDRTHPIVDLKTFGQQLLTFSQLADVLDVQQLYVGPQPVVEDKTMPSPTGCFIEDDLVEAYDAVIEDVAQSQAVPYISTRELFRGFELPKVIDEDGRHPNALGHAILHHEIATSLKSMGVL